MKLCLFALLLTGLAVPASMVDAATVSLLSGPEFSFESFSTDSSNDIDFDLSFIGGTVPSNFVLNVAPGASEPSTLQFRALINNFSSQDLSEFSITASDGVLFSQQGTFQTFGGRVETIDGIGTSTLTFGFNPLLTSQGGQMEIGDFNGNLFNDFAIDASSAPGGFTLTAIPIGITAVPEPSTLVLALCGVVGLVAVKRRKDRQEV